MWPSLPEFGVEWSHKCTATVIKQSKHGTKLVKIRYSDICCIVRVPAGMLLVSLVVLILQSFSSLNEETCLSHAKQNLAYRASLQYMPNFKNHIIYEPIVLLVAQQHWSKRLNLEHSSQISEIQFNNILLLYKISDTLLLKQTQHCPTLSKHVLHQRRLDQKYTHMKNNNKNSHRANGTKSSYLLYLFPLGLMNPPCPTPAQLPHNLHAEGVWVVDHDIVQLLHFTQIPTSSSTPFRLAPRMEPVLLSKVLVFV